MVKIAPSILSADFTKLGQEIKAISDANADLVHIDIMDGHFVPNLTIGPAVVKSIREVTTLPFDVHLMISEPDKYLDKFIDAGADIISVHAEACGHLHRTLAYIKNKNVKVGLAINPATSLSCIEPILSELDMLLIMTVNPGFPAQKFIKSVLPKIKDAHELINEFELKVELEVDGGINVDTAPMVAEAGADILVAGNAAFHGPAKTLEENIKLLQSVATKPK